MVDLNNPDMYFDNRPVLQNDIVHIVRTFFLWQGVGYLGLGIQSHGECTGRPVGLIAFANDFADIFEVRGMRRSQRGKAAAVSEQPARYRTWLRWPGWGRVHDLVAL